MSYWPVLRLVCCKCFRTVLVILDESQLQAFSVARRVVMHSAVVRTCRDESCLDRVHTTNNRYYMMLLTAWDVSSGKRTLTALGPFSLQNLVQVTQAHKRSKGEEKHHHNPTCSIDTNTKADLVAFSRACMPASQSWAQIESFSLAALTLSKPGPSLRVFSPPCTSSYTNVALICTRVHKTMSPINEINPTRTNTY